jgi:mRNA interferase MazF
MGMVVKRFDICLVNLDPTIGKEIKKIRPCLIISPDQSNMWLDTVIIIPLTSTLKNYPTRVRCIFQQKKGEIAVDQLRAIDTARIVKKIGKLDLATSKKVCDLLQTMFAF